MRHQFDHRGVDRAAIGVAVFNGVFTQSLVGDNKDRRYFKILMPLSEFADVKAFDVDGANAESFPLQQERFRLLEQSLCPAVFEWPMHGYVAGQFVQVRLRRVVRKWRRKRYCDRQIRWG